MVFVHICTMTSEILMVCLLATEVVAIHCLCLWPGFSLELFVLSPLVLAVLSVYLGVRFGG